MMCQVHTGAYVSLIAPGKPDYTACHPGNTITYHVWYILQVVFIATQTHVRPKSIGKEETNNRKEEK